MERQGLCLLLMHKGKVLDAVDHSGHLAVVVVNELNLLSGLKVIGFEEICIIVSLQLFRRLDLLVG